ncbi:fluoride exporter [Synechococcus sp. A18-25c]|uniref:fluoride efflux transporter FluC n=1 Tax=Synechococcus sp. A18-25c TaxID=1866938 RepID=UPI0016483B40|nr:CrcB family protein [Synechococcus sp. A18-25c]MEC8096302.1 CrcB family protein [Cyanobacteriota bacterium]QNJ18474.1 fluoride exporter [Synechococcus sp. A18-25c]
MADKTLSMRDELQQLLLVAAGAVPGALLRWQLGAALHDRDVLANVLGALILGLLLGLPCGPRLQLLIGVGFCGAFTTFSSWMVNSVDLISTGQPWAAVGLIGLTFGLGLGGAALGLLVGRALGRLTLRP